MDTEFIERRHPFQVIPKKDGDAAKIARELNKKGPVWKALVAPRPVPPGSRPARRPAAATSSRQRGDLHAAPNGIGAIEVWGLGGAKGAGVTICDIEGNWNRTHEGSSFRLPLIGGTLINDIGWRNHGTAVLGEMISIPDVRGTAGISHGARAVVQSTVVNGVFNAAAAINNAASTLKAGDVVLNRVAGDGTERQVPLAIQYLGQHLRRQ